MSLIKLSGNPSGTGAFTIAAPNSNSDRTLTLPDATGTVNVSGLANEVPAGSAGAPAIYPTGDTNTGIFFPAADTIAFAEGGVEAMRIDSSGNFMIGTTTALYAQKFSVSESGTNTNAGVFRHSGANPYGPYIEFSAATPNVSTRYFLACTDATAERATIRSNGGIANFSANNVNLSDERVKTDIAPLGSYWGKIKALQVVTYKYVDQTHDDDNIGVIAQQVESVAPEFVSNDGFGKPPEDGVPLKTIYEADLHYATLKALQEAMTRIETLEAEVAALKGASA